jgi:hypothetical protein
MTKAARQPWRVAGGSICREMPAGGEAVGRERIPLPGFCETGAQRPFGSRVFWSLQCFGPVQRATWPHQSPTCPSSMRTTLGNLLISLWGMRPCIGDRTRALSRRVSHGLRQQRCCRGECYEKPSSALSVGMHGNGTCRPCVPSWHGPSQRGPFTLQEANPCRRHHTKL